MLSYLEKSFNGILNIFHRSGTRALDRYPETGSVTLTKIIKTAVSGLRRDERQEIDKNLESLGITPVAAVVDNIASLPPSLSGSSRNSILGWK